jgi:hypothetical protein
LLHLLFDPEDRGGMFFRNINWLFAGLIISQGRIFVATAVRTSIPKYCKMLKKKKCSAVHSNLRSISDVTAMNNFLCWRAGLLWKALGVRDLL